MNDAEHRMVHVASLASASNLGKGPAPCRILDLNFQRLVSPRTRYAWVSTFCGVDGIFRIGMPL